MARIGNRAFVRLTDILDLEPGVVVDDLSASEVIPTLNVQTAVLSELASLRLFIKQFSSAGADTGNLEANFHIGNQWDEIWERSGQLDQALPSDHDGWVLQCGGQTDTIANLTEVLFYRRMAATVGTLATTPLFFADALAGNAALARGSNTDSPILSPLPWYVPTVTDDLQQWRIRTVHTGAAGTTMVFLVLGAEKGILPRLP